MRASGLTLNFLHEFLLLCTQRQSFYHLPFKKNSFSTPFPKVFRLAWKCSVWAPKLRDICWKRELLLPLVSVCLLQGRPAGLPVCLLVF